MPTTPRSIVDDRRSRQRQAALACEEDDIWNASQARENSPGAMVQTFTYPTGSHDPQCFVKFTSSRNQGLLEVERRNHEFAFNTLRELQQPASQESELLVCVPEIFRAFEYLDYYFLMMEFVPGKTLYQLSWEDACAGRRQRDPSTSNKYVDAGIRMLRVKAPPGAKPGPVGGGRIRHPLFKNCEATVPYRDVEMLETHLNKVSNHVKILSALPPPPNERRVEITGRWQVIRLRTYRNPDWTPTVRLEKELEFCYSNWSVQNFIIMTLGNHTLLYIPHFIDASFLPPSFMTMLLRRRRKTMLEYVQGTEHAVPVEEGDEEDQLALRTVEYFLQTSINDFGECELSRYISPSFLLRFFLELFPTANQRLLTLRTTSGDYPETNLDEIRRLRDQDFW